MKRTYQLDLSLAASSFRNAPQIWLSDVRFRIIRSQMISLDTSATNTSKMITSHHSFHKCDEKSNSPCQINYAQFSST